MIRTLAVKKDGTLLLDIPIQQLNDPQIKWYWVDFNTPSMEETSKLTDHFHFHPLAVKDCLHHLQRPKMDYCEGYQFLILHALKGPQMKLEEVDLFVAENFLVSFHYANLEEIDDIWERIIQHQDLAQKGPVFLTYKLIDKLVDAYFPYAHRIEDQLNEIESKPRGSTSKALIDQIFQVRRDLSKLRRTVIPMSDLLYRMINSERFIQRKDQRVLFQHIYNHLIKLSYMIESSREITSDIRDNYLSLNSYRMNTIMTTLTVISAIFIPLTFIVGVYGMNFEHMPELKWRYGYFMVLGFMLVVGVGMLTWFKIKGWFNQH
ncbi:magnesium/cobalt transporter CorA [Baia soyae]|uniref:Magnesium transport protein CorA n=1 Tax=Baia soyae TaxID=1544746 RepID=A0A4R2RVP3_9BACL|nr:magnesium/cobalt transporter CorA [Baia soyae]TCP64021.1 magnesium transporter [Baia soyae]